MHVRRAIAVQINHDHHTAAGGLGAHVALPISPVKGDAPDGLAAERSVTFHSFFMEPNGEQLAEIATLITNGTIHPVLDRTFPLDDVVAAYDYARSGSSNGKVAVVVR